MNQDEEKSDWTVWGLLACCCCCGWVAVVVWLVVVTVQNGRLRSDIDDLQEAGSANFGGSVQPNAVVAGGVKVVQSAEQVEAVQRANGLAGPTRWSRSGNAKKQK